MIQMLLLMVFLAPTIQYRFELPYFSFALMEPIVLLASVVLILRCRPGLKSLRLATSWPEIGLVALLAWASLIRPWSQDWKHGLSDVRDWLIPILAFLVVRITVRQGWRWAVRGFGALIVLTSIVGIFQWLTGDFRPFMSIEANLKIAPGAESIAGGVGWKPKSNVTIWEYYAERASLSEKGVLDVGPVLAAAADVKAPPFAVGFFAHPNSLGMFLAAGFMLALAWAAARKRPSNWLIPGLVGLALLLTYAKMAFLVLLVELGAYFLMRKVRSLRLLAALALLSIPVVALILTKLPPLLLDSLGWRYGLWTTAVHLLAESPSILLVGNGMDPFGDLAYYFQPHNTFVYMLLEYGLLGLGLILGVLVSIGAQGWRDGERGLWDQDLMLQAVWIATLGFFVVGLSESVLLGIEHRMIILNFLACYLGLRQDLLADERIGPQPVDGTRNA